MEPPVEAEQPPVARSLAVVFAPLLALVLLDVSMDPVDLEQSEPALAVPGLLVLVAMGVALLWWSRRSLADHPARGPLLALVVAAIALPWAAWLIRLVILTYATDVDLLQLAFTEGGWFFSAPLLLAAAVVAVQAWRRRPGWLALADALRGATGATAALVGGYFLLTVYGQAEKAERAYQNRGVPWVSPALLVVALALLAWGRRRA